ncbi:AAA family ATPase [Mycobacterium terramassiliense]|uniref:AAA family ATPase n=1 Tax=Mycobacterium terramassiliense TaxID=1841859 RepID=UPI00097D7A6A|nr:AAA family ATPase [Mycobacterium terramassiliense]
MQLAIEGLARKLAERPVNSSRHTDLINWAKHAFQLALGTAGAVSLDWVAQQFKDASNANGYGHEEGEKKLDGDIEDARKYAENDGPRALNDRPRDNTGIDYGKTDFEQLATNTSPWSNDRTTDDAAPVVYTDFAALLAGGLPDPPKPTVLQREDGVAIFYDGKRNELYGDPEDGKTMLVLAAAAACGGKVLFLDYDNNGPEETALRLIMLGADRVVLADRNRFRHIEPADAEETLRVVADCAGWATLVIVDCIGELLPLFRASSDSADDYTRVMQMVSAPLERGGAAVILLDHQAKGQESRRYGAGGTMAKRRAVSGVSINLVRKQTFTPGRGGMAELWVNKDRPGGLRAHCPKGEGRRQFAGTFVLDPPDPETGVAAWRVTAARAELPAETIDPVVERHYEAVQRLSADNGGAVSARDVAIAANGLPPGTPPTDTQDKTARRAIARLEHEGRLTRVPGASPKRWEVAA